MQITSRLPNIGTFYFHRNECACFEYNVWMDKDFWLPWTKNWWQNWPKPWKGFNQYAPMYRVDGFTGAKRRKNSSAGLSHQHQPWYRYQPLHRRYLCYLSSAPSPPSLQPGDEVILFEPAYDSYIPNIEINGAKAIPLPLTYPDYSIDWEMVRSVIKCKTKAIIINSPHNPTGSVISKSDIEELKKSRQSTNIFIISDEVYEHLIFDGLTHESILRYPGLLERSLFAFHFGKTYHCTGWKLGYCIALHHWWKSFRKVHPV